MKQLLLALLVLCSLSSWAQPKVNRSAKANTVQDFRLMADTNLVIPRYPDTASANRSIGLDSAAALIYTYDVKGLWLRSHAPKRWVRFSPYWNLGFGLSAPNDYTVEADTAALATLWDLGQAVANPDLYADTDTSGRIYFPGYGLGAPNDSTFSADTSQLATLWDVSQKVDTSGRTYYVKNGLSVANDSTFKLGGALTEHTTLNTGPYTFLLDRGEASGSDYIRYRTRTTGDLSGEFNVSLRGTTYFSGNTLRSDMTEWYNSDWDGVIGYTQMRRWADYNGVQSLVVDKANRGQVTAGHSLSASADSALSYALLEYYNEGLDSTRVHWVRLNDEGIALLINTDTAASTSSTPDAGLVVQRTTGNLRFSQYPSSRNDGVLTKVLGTDASGNVLLGTVSSTVGGRTYYAAYNVTMPNDSTFMVPNTYNTSDTLTAYRTVKVDGQQLTFDDTGKFGMTDSRFWINTFGLGGSWKDASTEGTLTLNEEFFDYKLLWKGAAYGDGTAGNGYSQTVITGDELQHIVANDLGQGHFTLFAGITTSGNDPSPIAARIGVSETSVTGQMGLNIDKDTLKLGYDNTGYLSADFGALHIGRTNYLVLPTAPPTYADNAAATAGGLAVGTVYQTADGTLKRRY